jgi:hypothetical protein
MDLKVTAAVRAGFEYASVNRDVASRFLLTKKKWFCDGDHGTGAVQTNDTRWKAIIWHGLLNHEGDITGFDSREEDTMKALMAEVRLNRDADAREFVLGIECCFWHPVIQSKHALQTLKDLQNSRSAESAQSINKAELLEQLREVSKISNELIQQITKDESRE